MLEIYFLLTLLVGGGGQTLLNALILGTVERLITIVFKFVPLRLGVDHIGAGSAAGLLGIGSATGITIATVRTARNLFWAGVGLTLLIRRSSIVDRPSSTTDRMTIDDWTIGRLLLRCRPFREIGRDRPVVDRRAIHG